MLLGPSFTLLMRLKDVEDCMRKMHVSLHLSFQECFTGVMWVDFVRISWGLFSQERDFSGDQLRDTLEFCISSHIDCRGWCHLVSSLSAAGTIS